MYPGIIMVKCNPNENTLGRKFIRECCGRQGSPAYQYEDRGNRYFHM